MKSPNPKACQEFLSDRSSNSLTLDHKYRRVISDIETLRNSLERLQVVIKSAEQQYARREWHRDARPTELAEALWPRLTGDFYQTLLESQSLLSRHDHLRGGRTNALSNLRWWWSTEDAVNNLTARLRFHIAMVEFYARPIELDAVIRNGSQIQQLRRQVANLEYFLMTGGGPTPPVWGNIVSDELRAKLEAEFNTNRPRWCMEGSAWPLKEAFDALNFHFARGTVKFNPTPDGGKVPELQQYLNLSKAIWILEEIKQCDQFKAAGNESIWAEYMRQYGDDLRGQVHRFDTEELHKPPAQQLLELPSDFYAISTREETNTDLVDAGKAGLLDEKILEIDLPSNSGNRKSALSVFRENDTEFRLVMSTREADTLVAQYDKEVEVDMDRNRLIPVYGNPNSSSSPQYTLLLLSEKGRKPKEFNFSDSEDVKKLQRALTGYRVHHDMPVARWCIDGSPQGGDSGQGKLQLWQCKPLPPIVESSPSGVSGGNLLVRSSISNGSGSPSRDFIGWKGFPNLPLARPSDEHRSRSSSAELENVQVPDAKPPLTDSTSPRRSRDHESLRTRRTFSQSSTSTTKSKNVSQETQKRSSVVSDATQVSRSSIMSDVHGPRSKGVEFSKPQPPVLVIFTLCEGSYRFLHLTCKFFSRRCNP